MFHKKLDQEVLDLQLGLMEQLLTAKRWDEIRVQLEKVVERIEDSPQLSSPDKLTEIKVIINKSVKWLAAAEKLKPKVSFGVTRGP
ncbi:unnamed protein product [Phytophthora lilii]|uniref:Unnamed protein product n=1 Tax=Phytophthora lilii TaxID=2077276 RepID=A0A9W6TB94_9STRA|nr:unnamed protein product [Phytophthora lilii]